MGGGGKGSYQQTSTYQPPAWALAGGQQSVQTAQELAQTPFEIPVQPIAGFSPQQSEAFQEVQNAQGMSQPYYNAATGLEAAGANPNISQYFGAESSGVMSEMENIFGQQAAQNTGQLTQDAGGVGASRIGIGQAELANQQGLAAGQTLAGIMGQSVSQAQTGAQLEQSAGTNIANIGTSAENEALTGATAELQTGTTQQQQEQNQLNAQYENILQGISWPFQTNQYLGSMAAGVTPAMGGTGVTSGNVKSSMVNTSGLGKGATALGSMGKSGGGAIPYYDDDAGEIKYARGGRTPFDMVPEHKQSGGPTLGEMMSVNQEGGAPTDYDYEDSYTPASTSTGTSAAASPTMSVAANPFGTNTSGASTGLSGNTKASLYTGGTSFQAGGAVLGAPPPVFQTAQPTAPAAPTPAPATTTPAAPVTYGNFNGPTPSTYNPATGTTMAPYTGAVSNPFGAITGLSKSGQAGNSRAGYQSGGNVIPGDTGLGGFAPASGQTVMIPFAPSEGGPQALTLGDAGVPGAPNIHAPSINWNTGVAGEPTGAGAAAAPSFANPQLSMLNQLMGEHQALSSKANALMSKSGGSGGVAHKQSGGAVAGAAGSQSAQNPFVVSSTVPTLGVQSLLGSQESNGAGGPNTGGSSIIPNSPAQGHPSPQQQQATQYKGPNPMSVSNPASYGMGKGQGKGGSSGNSPTNPLASMFGAAPNYSQTGAPTPTAASTTGGGNPLAEPGSGKGSDTTGADIGPTADNSDLGDTQEFDLFAQTGGAIWPEHLQAGGDVDSLGTSAQSPYTPSGEISGTDVPYMIASNIYGSSNANAQPIGADPSMVAQQPQATAPSSGTGSSWMPSFMTPPTDRPGYGPPAGSGTADFTGQPLGMPNVGTSSAAKPETFTDPMSGLPMQGPSYGPPMPPRQNTPPLSMPEKQPVPPTGDEGREQQGIQNLEKAAAKPIAPTPPTPTPEPRPAGAPQAGATQAGVQPGKPATPQPAPVDKVAKANQLLDTPLKDLGKQFGAQVPGFVGDMTGRQFLQKYPQYTGLVYPYLTKAGIDQDSLTRAITGQGPAPGATGPAARNKDAEAIIKTARELQMDPVMLGEIMYYETKINPASHNPTYSRTNPGEVAGLIGFDRDNRIKYFGGPELERVTRLSIPDQMAAVKQYFLDRGWKPGVNKPNDLASAYSIVNAGGLGPHGEPKWNARDVNGDLAHHVENIKALYQPSYKFLYGTEGPGETKTASRETTPPTGGVAPSTGAPVTSGAGPAPGAGHPTAGPPPGMPPINKASQFLMTLGTGDPTAYLRMRSAELGLYQQYADWDAARNMQYGDMTPQEAGGNLADLSEKTQKLIGAVGGAHEEGGGHGSITAAAATGQQGPGGGSIRPVEGEPPTSTAPTGAAGVSSPQAPGPAPYRGPPRNATEAAVDAAMRGISSGNPRAMAAGNAQLNAMASRGQIEADTVNKRLEALGHSIGVIPGVGPVRYNANDGSATSLLTGRQVLPPILPTPPPGTLQSGAPSGGGTPTSPFQAAPQGPAPAGGTTPQPLPSGAEPHPQPGTAGAPGADIGSDPVFQPRGQAPNSSMEMANDPKAGALAYDERAWYPEGKKMIEDEAKDALKDARGHINADKQARVMLAQLRDDLNALPKSGPLSPGPLANRAAHAIGIYNNLARMAGVDAKGQPLLPQINPNAVGSIEQINKLSNTLAFALARTLGSREAVQIVQQARQSVPSADVSPTGSRKILEGLMAGIDMDQDYYSGMQKWSSSNMFYGGSIKGYDDWFQDTHPAQMYSMRGVALAARDGNGNAITPDVMQALREHPDRAQAFDRQYNSPGLGNYILHGQ